MTFRGGQRFPRVGTLLSSTALITIASIAVASVPSTALAQDAWWKAGATGSWFEPTNWQGGVVPAQDYTVDMRNGGTTIVDAPGAVGNAVFIGADGSNIMRVESGGTFEVFHQLALGFLPGSSGTMIVDGAGSTVTVHGLGTALAWKDGAGSVTVTDGGKFITANVSAFGGAASGTVSVSGADSLFRSENGATFGTIGGAAWSLSVADRGAFSISGDLDVNVDTTINLSGGGILDVQNIRTNAGQTTFSVDGADATSIGADLQETGGINSLTKTGSGVLALTGDTEFSGGATVAAGTLRMGDGGTSGSIAGNITIAGGALLAFDRADASTYAGNVDGTGGFLKAGAGTLTLTGDMSGFSGEVDVGAGTLDVGTQLNSGSGIIDADGTDPAETPTVRVSGPAIWTSSASLMVGDESAGALVIENGGQVVTNSGIIAHDIPGTGNVTVSGNGSVWTAGVASIGHYGNGTLVIEDGGHVDSGTIIIGGGASYATGTVKVSGEGSVLAAAASLAVGLYGNGTLTLTEGGRVAATGIDIDVTARSDAVGTLNIGAASGEAAEAAGTLDADSVAFGPGTGTVVFNHLGNPDGSDLIFNPSLTGVGTIRHESGTTVLSADSSGFGGTTAISGGTLLVGDHTGSGALGGAINVQSGATLGGSGTVGTAGSTTTVADGAHLAPGNSVGTLTFAGNLMLSSGSILDYELGNPGSSASAPGTSDRIDVSGDLALDGTLNLSQSGDPADGMAGLGYYRLMTYGGALSGDGLEMGATPSPAAYEIQAGGGNVDLVVAADGDDTLQHWQGGDGTWNAPNEKWLNQGGNTLAPWAGNHAVFKNEPGGFSGGVIAVEGAQSFKGLQFVDSGYRLEGSGQLQVNGSDSADGNAEIRVLASETAEIATTITGTGGITKTQGGTLVLEGNNTYQGGTSLLGGTLSVSSDANLGAASGGLTFNGGILQNTAALTTARDVTLGSGGGSIQTDASLSISGTLSGTGALTKTGAAGLTLTGTNTYAGGTAINRGTVHAEVTGALGTGPVNINQGALSFSNTAGAADLTITNNQGYITFHDATSADNATIINSNGGNLNFLSNASAGSARITNNADSRTNFSSTSSADNATIINNAGGLVSIDDLDSDGIAIGSLSGDGKVILGSKALTLGGLGLDDTVGGVVEDGASGTGGSLAKIGAGTLTLTGENSYTGGTKLNAGTLQIGNGGTSGSIMGNVEIASAGTLAFNREGSVTFAGVLTGSGAIDKSGTGTLTLTGNSAAFAGTTTIDAGTLAVNGTLGGALDVMTGGRLQGTGKVGTTTIASGATIAPGNSIGTLTIDGDITFAPGSTYEAEINPALDSDLIDASGTATINGGTVHAVKAGGVYTPGSRWTIIGADGGVTGTFDDLTQNMPFVDLALAYDANNVYIDATRNAVAFCDVAQTRNQCATGDGVESTGAGNPVYDAVAAIPDEDSARQALDALSGEIHASARTALIEDSHFVRDAVNDRIRSAFGDMTASSMPVLAYGPDGAVPAAADGIGPVAWGQAFGAWGSFDGGGNAAGLDTSTGGFLTGIDGAVTSNIRLGLLTGYSHSSFEVDGRASSGSSENYHLGLYGGGQWDAFRLSGGLAYTWHDIEASRSVAFTGFADSLSADYDAGTFQAFGEAGYRIDTTVASFEPFVGLAHVSLHSDGFTEDGGPAALKAGSQTLDTTFTTLGLHASTHFDLAGMRATAHGTLGWRHAFGDTTPLSMQAFAGGDAFAVAGVPIAKDAALIRAGLDLDITGYATLGVAYQGQIASDAEEHGFSAKLNVKF